MLKIPLLMFFGPISWKTGKQFEVKNEKLYLQDNNFPMEFHFHPEVFPGDNRNLFGSILYLVVNNMVNHMGNHNGSFLRDNFKYPNLFILCSIVYTFFKSLMWN